MQTDDRYTQIGLNSCSTESSKRWMAAYIFRTIEQNANSEKIRETGRKRTAGMDTFEPIQAQFHSTTAFIPSFACMTDLLKMKLFKGPSQTFDIYCRRNSRVEHAECEICGSCSVFTSTFAAHFTLVKDSKPKQTWFFSVNEVWQNQLTSPMFLSIPEWHSMRLRHHPLRISPRAKNMVSAPVLPRGLSVYRPCWTPAMNWIQNLTDCQAKLEGCRLQLCEYEVDFDHHVVI